MKRISGGAETPQQRPNWVQTDRKVHELWASLGMRKPAASAVLHCLTACVGDRNAVVIAQKTLAKMVGVSDRTIRTALSVLEQEHWIQIVRIGKGKEAAYILNDRVAWTRKRTDLKLSLFTAEIIADAEDQSEATLSKAPLNRLPRMFDNERQLPTGPGLPPPSEPFLDGMEPDLPTKHNQSDIEDFTK